MKKLKAGIEDHFRKKYEGKNVKVHFSEEAIQDLEEMTMNGVQDSITIVKKEEMMECPCCHEKVPLGDDEPTDWDYSGDAVDGVYYYTGSGGEFTCPKCGCVWMNTYTGSAVGNPEIGNPVENVESDDVEIVKLGAIIYNSKEECGKHYALHPLYGYPVTCRVCGENVHAVPGGRLTCKCRVIVSNYACGVHVRRN